IAEIETDKATMEVEAVDEGRIGKILVAEGSEHVPVNQPIALLLTDGESSPSSFETRPAAAPQDEGSAPKPHPEEGAPAPVSKDEASVPQPSSRRGEGAMANGHATQIFASPLARRLARERGIDLGRLHGSGPHGRVVKRDIERAALLPKAEQAEPIEARAAKPLAERPLVPSRPPAPIGLSDEQVRAMYQPRSYELIPHDNMRRVIAERLTMAKQTIPHFYLSIDCKLDALLKARERLNAMAPEDGPRTFKLSVNDFIIKALAMALQQVPRANATWTEEGLLLHRSSDIAVAVALPGGGLFTPVVRSAEVKSLSEISNEMRDLATRARSKRLAPHEYQGGTTAISNLGMYGISKFDAVINPPQASILAVGKAEKRPIVKKGKVKVATMMSVTLSVDHRVIDGALGAELLAAFKDFIEDPVTILV
ncbi:MAG TPA: pyruvate dehydrogenase complex dihydrolipoamide acetyltransferase, partial [Methyloceanibacter sp.]|nr:pyruvate dehydrogenase complex dihydrolipoamide acetyltransferase [Methyloceanibacter sp.]